MLDWDNRYSPVGIEEFLERSNLTGARTVSGRLWGDFGDLRGLLRRVSRSGLCVALFEGAHPRYPVMA